MIIAFQRTLSLNVLQMTDTLESMFPGRPRRELQEALDRNNGSVERAVEHLLSPSSLSGSDGLTHPTIVYDTGNPIADRARARQMEQDEIMARAIAMEEQREAERSPGAVARDLVGSVAGATPSMPSMSSIGDAVAPVLTGIQNAGKAAMNAMAGLYEDFVGAPEESADAQRRASVRRSLGEADTDTQVLHGELSSPRRPGLQARPRRSPGFLADEGSSSEKKRE